MWNAEASECPSGQHPIDTSWQHLNTFPKKSAVLKSGAFAAISF